MEQDPTPTRRSVVAGAAAALGVAATGGLTACGGSGGGTPSSGVAAAPPTSVSVSPDASSTGGDIDEGALADVNDIPVGGALALEAAGGTVILAQPTPGKVVAFSAVCPHQGCGVAPKEDRLVCPCHGSAFELATGKVLNGPATRNLTAVPVRVEGSSVIAG